MGIGVYICDLLRRQLPAVAAGQTSWQDAFDGVLLFVDIAESSALTERFAAGTHGAEQLNRILNSYFGAVFDIVTSYGGDVVSIEGDAVLAVWRTEGAGPGQVARRAAAAALELAARSGRSTTPDSAADLRHRVALSAGAITAGGMVAAGGRGFLVITGAPVRALADLAHAGLPGEVVVTPGFAERLEAAGAVGPGALRDSRLTGMIAGPSDGLQRLDPSTGDDDHPGAARQFLPSFVGQRVAEGQTGWLAEFRELSTVCLTLPGHDPAAPDATEQIEQALTVVSAAIAPLAAGVSELVVGDKGVTMMIEFGLPGEAREHNAGRAVEAAWRIRQALVEERLVGVMGVATGRAFCGDVGSRTRRHVLVTGSLMHRGARLTQAAGPGQILVDEESWRLVAPTRGFTVGARELRRAKGFREPLAAYPLEVRRPQQDAPGPGGRTLQGRAREIEVFETLLDGLAHGRGALLAIEAEAGGGKTHLLDALRGAATGRGLATLTAAGSPFQVLESYAGLRGLVRQLLAGADEQPEPTPAQLGARVREALRGDPAEARAALIGDILPLPFEKPGLAAEISGQARVAGLEDVVTGLLRHRRASSGPLVVFVDDLHWLDQPSAQLLAAVVRRLGDVLWVVASRPPGDDAGSGDRFMDAADQSLRLEPLPAAAVTAMVADLLGVDHVPPRLAAFIRRRSGGLPFHAEQLTRVLVERALVTVEAGRCRVAAVDLEVQAVPQNLRELIIGRLDRLPSAQQVTAKVASVIGRGISGEAVLAIHPFAVEPAQVDAMLSELAEAAVLTPVASSSGRPVYDFTHATIREVTYDLLTLAQRQPLHRQLATFLEQRHGDDLEPRLAELAQHWERADEPATAIDYRRLAAAQAIRRSANDDALVHLEHLDQLAATAAIELSPSRRAELARLRGDACHELSRFDEADEWFRRCAGLSGIRVPATRPALMASLAVQAATQLAHRLGLASRLGLARLGPAHRRRAPVDRERDQLAAHIFAKLSEHAYFNGDVLAILHTTVTSLNRAESSAAVPEMVEALGGMAIGFGTAGQHRVARYYRRRAIARAEEDGTLHDQGFAHLLSAVYSFHAGDWVALDRHCEDGAAIFGVLGDRFRFQSCRVIRAYGDLMRGDYGRAEAGLSAFGADAEQVENVPVRAWVLAGLGLVDAVRGRASEPVLRRIALARDDSMLHDAERLLCDGIRAAAELRAGHADEALQAASTGLANMRRNPPTMGIALFSVTAVADVHLSLVQPADPDPEALAAARDACRAARTYATKIDICRPRERLVRGRLALAQGNRHAARASFRQGVTEAVRHQMPLDEALCRLAWAEVGETTAEQHRQRGVAHATLERIGADPWLVWPRDAAYRR